MPVTQIGLVGYMDSPGVYFRRVWPQLDDSELDDIRWVTEGVDPARFAVLTKVAVDSEEASQALMGAP